MELCAVTFSLPHQPAGLELQKAELTQEETQEQQHGPISQWLTEWSNAAETIINLG